VSHSWGEALWRRGSSRSTLQRAGGVWMRAACTAAHSSARSPEWRQRLSTLFLLDFPLYYDSFTFSFLRCTQKTARYFYFAVIFLCCGCWRDHLFPSGTSSGYMTPPVWPCRACTARPSWGLAAVLHPHGANGEGSPGLPQHYYYALKYLKASWDLFLMWMNILLHTGVRHMYNKLK